ncbi:pentapeptide repeat-containing protein [Rhodomicrobium sp. Az07]|uniref:pentapeptide repeat-containing protein n=1 Tax=Rhodomicrobium sp. Az07 TaxID=2839034 RepID=UPI001BEAEF7D|nr:pentapeptide repeat-containing protein [Rhodomicrobium sp. Az07]MBT3070612.1 pentapeptide repeat-containing protein [Rhodomicrobium sp. Az07]
MNRDETVALFLRGREAWNAWANRMLAERKALQGAGKWAARKLPWGELESQNDDTRQWLEDARADFSRCVFLVRGKTETEDAPEKDNEGDASASVPVISISVDADRIDFGGIRLYGDASGSEPFKTISVDADLIDFGGFVFPGPASFLSATFSGPARFRKAIFSGEASFRRATFSGYATFVSATYSDTASFWRATFSGEAVFPSTTFSGIAYFERATFSRYASFERTTFFGEARFLTATFSGDADFQSATFIGDANFRSATFSGNSAFDDARFNKAAIFKLAGFRKYASFECVSIEGPASFRAIHCEGAFIMAGATFEKVPDFIQAHFAEAPRLDDIMVVGRVSEKHPRPVYEEEKGKDPSWRTRQWRKVRHVGGRIRTAPRRKIAGIWTLLRYGDSNNLGRWRALQRLAVQGHDTERELEFNTREIRSQRYLSDWPLFWLLPRVSWVGFLRFWAGLAYGLSSNYGRSLALPLAWWLAAIAIGAVVYASQSPDLVKARETNRSGGSSALAATVGAAWDAWTEDKRCYEGEARPADPEKAPPYIGALTETLRKDTGIAAEALHLAFRNALIVLDGSSDAAHRTYGCLYGVELYGGSNPVAVVPSAVSSMSAAQKLFSALMIFLFGLALRNMLKVK